MTRSVGGLLPSIVREYFLLVTSDFVHCCTAIIPQQPVVVRFTKPLTACGVLKYRCCCLHIYESNVLFADEIVFANNTAHYDNRDTRVRYT